MRAIEGERNNASYYFPIFITRRILLSFLALYLGQYPWLQMHVFLLLSWFWLGYITMVKPFQKEFVWYFELFNEIFVLIVCL